MEGLADERLIMELTEKVFGGKVEHSMKEEDLFLHVDFWWISDNGKRYGFDVKGKRRNKRSDVSKSDDINWVEIRNVAGNQGWLYGKSVYFVFIIGTKAVYVPKKDLIALIENKVDKNIIVYENPSEFYVQYQRKGRSDIIVKVPNKDLIGIAKHVIEMNENEKNNV